VKNLFSFLAGLIFAIGLAVSQMTNPAKIHGFLDLAGVWDPSLLMVMGGAVGVYAVLFRRSGFSLAQKTKLDAPLLIGSAIFGIGWGLGGFCPGPAIANLSTLYPQVLLFTAGMLAGIGLYVLQRLFCNTWWAKSPFLTD